MKNIVRYASMCIKPLLGKNIVFQYLNLFHILGSCLKNIGIYLRFISCSHLCLSLCGYLYRLVISLLDLILSVIFYDTMTYNSDSPKDFLERNSVQL